jgi:hypothetical protein
MGFSLGDSMHLTSSGEKVVGFASAREAVLARYRTRKTMIEESNRPSATILARCAKRLCVSLVIDTGTIERGHCLDLMVISPYIDDQLRHADRRHRKQHQNNDEYPRQHAIGSSDRFFSRSDWLQESIKM